MAQSWFDVPSEFCLSLLSICLVSVLYLLTICSVIEWTNTVQILDKYWTNNEQILSNVRYNLLGRDLEGAVKKQRRSLHHPSGHRRHEKIAVSKLLCSYSAATLFRDIRDKSDKDFIPSVVKTRKKKYVLAHIFGNDKNIL